MKKKTRKSTSSASAVCHDIEVRLNVVASRLRIDQIAAWVAKRYPGATVEPAFELLVEKLEKRRQRPADVEALEGALEALGRYLLVHLPTSSSPVVFMKDIELLPDVASATFKNTSSDWSTQQWYRFDASYSGGVNANAVLSVNGATGAPNEVKLGVITRGFTTHEDLATTTTAGTPSEQALGVSLLGITSAKHTPAGQGILGLVPDATLVLASYGGNTDAEIEESLRLALESMLGSLGFGDVLLLDAARPAPPTSQGLLGSPAETYPKVFDLIRVLSAYGITVVEPAGDDHTSIDAVLEHPTKDSGALLVGATDTGSCFVTGLSNYGARVDFFALGKAEDVVSTLVPGYGYVSTGSTRWAAAIIAGAAVSAQTMYSRVNAGEKLSPGRLRSLLLQGAASQVVTVPGQLIGKMPNLGAIAGMLGAPLPVPDVFVRDFPGDTGDPYGVHNQYWSPDLITRQTAIIQEPALAFPDPSEMGYSQDIEWGQTNYLYVRVWNRRSAAATDVNVKVYWIPPTASSSPSLWTLIGQTTIPTIPGGTTAVPGMAFGTIPWDVGADDLTTPAAVGHSVHSCFAIVVDCPADPIFSWSEGNLSATQFHDLANASNNIAWKNFNIVESVEARTIADDGAKDARSTKAATREKGVIPLEVFVPGLPAELGASIKVEADLPPGSKIEMEAPPRFMSALVKKPLGAKQDADTKWSRFSVGPKGQAAPSSLLLDERDPLTKIRLLVYIPPKYRKQTHDIAICHVSKGRVIGRYTFRISLQ